MMRHFLIVVLLFVFHLLTALPADTAQIREQFRKASILNENKNFEQAVTIAESALKAMRLMSEAPPDLEVGLMHVLGDCALDRGDYPNAIRFYEQADAILQAKGITTDSLQVENLNKTGNYYREIKNFETGLEYLERGLQLGRKIFGNSNLIVANLYNNIGICFDNIGDFEKALEYYRQALAVRSDLLPDPHPQIAQSYNNLGLCLRSKGAFDEALEVFQNALDIYRRFYGRDHHQDIAAVLLNIGTVYDAFQQPDLFLDYTRRALNIYHNTLNEMHPALATSYNNLANAHLARGNYQRASALHRQSLDIRIHCYGENHPDVAMSYFNIGASSYFAGDSRRASQAFDRCFQALQYQVGPGPVFEKVNNPHILLELLKFIAEIEITGFQDSGDFTHLSRALDQYRQIDQLLDYLRNRYEAADSKLSLMNAAHDLYDTAIGLALTLYQKSQEKRYLNEALRFSEKSKGILLLEALKKAEAEVFSGIPNSRIQGINELESSIGELEKRRFLAWGKSGARNDSLLNTLNSRIIEQKEKLSQHIEDIERDFPQYYQLRYETSPVPVETIQNELLAPRQTMLEYFLGAGDLHIFVINKNDFNVVSINLDASFFQYLDTFNRSIRRFPLITTDELSQNLQAYAEAAHRLFQYLIQPVVSMIEDQLIIIPDGELGFLSFGALLTGLPEDPYAIKTYPYLVRDFSISYNYSASLLREMIEQKNKAKLRPYLGLAPEFRKGNEEALSPLKYNREEIQRIQAIMGGRAFYQQEATKSNFLEHQAGYQIIHLATHGKANSAHGDYSFLAFSEGEQRPGKHSLLYVKEIYNMPTNADMVVLSACETGIGELQKGEGIASIARSFSYAGARSLIATQWNVDDESTFHLVQLFFENISAGYSKDQAIQMAQLSLLESRGQGNAHPYYWASFIPIGSMEPIPLHTPFSFLRWVLPVTLVLLSLLLWLKKGCSTNLH